MSIIPLPHRPLGAVRRGRSDVETPVERSRRSRFLAQLDALYLRLDERD